MLNIHHERNQEATVYIGNLDEQVTDAIIWELMVQGGPVVNVHLPKDRVTMQHQGYGFCEFASEEDADYAIKIMNMIKLYGKPIRVNKASSDKKQMEVGATIFVGNLDPEVDEKMLFDAFSSFGVVVQAPKLARDPDTGTSKGYAFIGFDSFEASDAAIEAMNGQHLMNRPMNVNYALKKDGKGERHGSAAERLLAAQARKNKVAQFALGVSGALMSAIPPSTTTPVAVSSAPTSRPIMGYPTSTPNGMSGGYIIPGYGTSPAGMGGYAPTSGYGGYRPQ